MPPSSEDIAPVDDHLKDWEMLETHGSIHHLYWPGKFYFNAGAVAYAFRKHKLNVIKNFDREAHNNIHWRYDPIVRTQPAELMPDEKTMKKFLEDAIWVDYMWQYAQSVVHLTTDSEQMKNPDEGLERRDKLLLMARQAGEYALESNTLPSELVQLQITGIFFTHGIDLSLGSTT